MTGTSVTLDDERWRRVLEHLDGADDESLSACRDAIAEQLGETRSSVDPDTAFELLSDPVRRAVLRRAREHDEIEMTDLVDRVAGELDNRDENLRLALHHTHVPKLDDAGVVRLADGRVRYDGDPLLDCLASIDEE